MTKEEQKDKEDLEWALKLIDNVIARVLKKSKDDYDSGWLTGISFSLETFINFRRSGERKK